MNIFKKIVIGISFIMLMAAPVATLAIPQSVAAAGPNCERTFLGMPPWYRGLVDPADPNCDIKPPEKVGGLSNFIWMIVLNVIEIGLFIVGYAALFFIIYGGFLFLTGGSNPSQTEKARKTLLNAVIGLVISISAIAVVKLIFGIFK